jgi:dipeptidyl aminopeptidase/acylaminoacyl peptidase
LAQPVPDGPTPVDWCLDGRDLTEPRLSPDGSCVAVVVRWQRAAAIVLVDVMGGPERLLTTSPPPSPGRGMGGGCFDWLPDGRGVVYAAVDGELWLQPVDAAAQRLTELDRTCRAPAVSPDGRFVVFVVDDAEVWLRELAPSTASATPPGAPLRCRRLDDGDDAFCSDPHVGPDSASVVWSGWSPPAMPWDAAHVVRVDLAADESVSVPHRWRPDASAVQQPRLLADGRLASIHDASGWLNLHVGDDPVIVEAAEHGDPPWGMGQRSYAVSPDGRRVAYASNAGGIGSLRVIEPGSSRSTEIAGAVHGQLTWGAGHLTALRSGPRAPTSVVVYDTETWAVTELLVGPVEGWRHVVLPEPERVVVPAQVGDADPVDLHARRYPAGRGRLLCWVHGGPTDQWQADFRARIVHWWSRGWDVLVVDPRGTTGHGRAYRTALEGAWGRVDVDDTATLVRHAHRQGWATPATTVVTGGSSGGLTVLGMLADHPALVAGGVTSYPVSDLADLATTTHRFEAHYTETLVGPADDLQTHVRLVELSPLHRAHLIRGPLLVFHGSDDPVVPVAQSESLVDRIRQTGGAVELVVYEGEGHGFRDREHQLDEYARTERFLDDVVSSDAEANRSG